MSGLMAGRVLLTGGTGFVGRHLAQALADKVQLSCLLRATSHGELLPRGTRLCYASLESGSGLDEAMRGQDCLIHLAGTLFGASWQSYLQGNVGMARQLGAAARRAGLRRVIMVSSLAATGPCGQSPGVDEQSVSAPVSAYGWSKYMAELALKQELAPETEFVVLRPPIIYGAGDKGLLPCFRAARLGLVTSPGLRDFPLSLVHVSDAVQALLCCLQNRASGLYHVNDGAEHSMASLGRAMAAVFGRKALVLRTPRPVLAVSAALADLSVRLGLPQSPWTLDKYREARQAGWLCSATRISSELGYAPTLALRAGLEQSIAGYRHLGWL